MMLQGHFLSRMILPMQCVKIILLLFCTRVTGEFHIRMGGQMGGILGNMPRMGVKFTMGIKRPQCRKCIQCLW